jgi:hypothetical protein
VRGQPLLARRSQQVDIGDQGPFPAQRVDDVQTAKPQPCSGSTFVGVVQAIQHRA